jgi:hypothetical protein
VWERNDSALAPFGELGNGTLDLGQIVNAGGYGFNLQGPGKLVDCSPELLVRSRLWMHQDEYACHRWHSFSQYLEPLSAHRRLEVGEAGDVPARVGQTLDEAASDRISHENKYDRHPIVERL